MPTKNYKSLLLASDLFSINTYIKLTKNKLILPFYHTVLKSNKPHLSEIGYYREYNLFKEDILFFTKNYQSIPISKIDFANYNSFHLTFDDGLSEVYSEVAPLLFDNKIHATFFINSDFIDNKNLFYRHKISIILTQLKNSKTDLDKISNYLNVETQQIYSKINSIKDVFLINAIAEILRIDFSQYLFDFKPYLTTLELKDLMKMGFQIGNHSKNHPNFKNIDIFEQKMQVFDCNLFLKNELNIIDYYFSFPFGDQNIENDFFQSMYSELNILNSFGVSGLKNDGFSKHKHRILMENNELSAIQIIKYEYLYFMCKSFFGKNYIKRN